MLKSILFFAAGALASTIRLPVVEPRAAAAAAAQVEVEVEAKPAVSRDTTASSCVYTCGSVCYWQEDIDEALEQGYADYKSGSDPGGYPHQYNDYEGFTFPTKAPWYEFPILSTYKVYTGGSPGADRVIFDGSGTFDSLITHTGASGDDFVACTKA